jgi:hypothetical protein
MTQRRVLVNAIVAAHYIKTTYQLTVSPVTVRSWARRGRIGSHGAGRQGDRFDLDEIDIYIRKRLGRGDVAP